MTGIVAIKVTAATVDTSVADVHPGASVTARDISAMRGSAVASAASMTVCLAGRDNWIIDALTRPSDFLSCGLTCSPL